MIVLALSYSQAPIAVKGAFSVIDSREIRSSVRSCILLWGCVRPEASRGSST